MKQLDETQLHDLADYLRIGLRRYEPLQEELLDHLACMIEEKMASGMDFKTAKSEALEYFTKDEVQRTEGKTLYFVHTKPVLMKIFSLLGITIALGIIVFPDKEQEPKPEFAATVEVVEPELIAPNFLEFALPTDPPDIAPLNGNHHITSGYGMRVHPVFNKKMLHRGMDFKAPLGTPILATADGTIEFADDEPNYGLKIVIQHDGQYKSLYAHMSEIKVAVGEKVTKGTVIGLVGNSGKSTAPHLHYEIIKDGKAVNPAEYLPKS